MRTNLCAFWAHNWSLGARILAVCLGQFFGAVFWICLLIFYFSLLKYTYHYNYRSHISLQVAKLAKSAGVQILIFPTVLVTEHTEEKNKPGKARETHHAVHKHIQTSKQIETKPQ